MRTRTRTLGGSALLLLAGLLGGCTARASTAELYPEIVEHAGRKVEEVRFTGTEPFSRDTLLTMINTQPSRCSFLGLPFCVPLLGWGRQEFHVQPEQIRQDVASLARFYRAQGYFGTRVDPDIELDGDDAIVTFAIARGDPILLDLLEVTGTEGVVDPDSLERALPLQPGDVFQLAEFAASWEEVRRALTSRGHAYAEVLRNFSVDTIDNRAVASLDAIPGPRVVVDSIMVRGADNLGRKATLQQLTFGQGDVLRRSRLAESQRNLFELELVQIAAVNVAPDSVQRVPGDSSRASVLVQIAENPVHQIDAAVGFGTEECLRAEAQWASRSFGGGARRLALFASASKLGTGDPFSVKLGEQICQGSSEDPELARFDYRLSAELSQPYFLDPNNRLALTTYMERISEPSVHFQREAIGSRISITRRLGERSAIALSLDAERGSTRASPALFCAAFQVCDPALADSLGRARFRNELGLSWSLDRSNSLFNPTSGYTLRSGLGWATAFLGSDVRFLRWSGEGQVYREVRPGWVAAGALRLGHFFRTATLDPGRNFLPPEERFFAGGATSVRGFDRNALGPGTWVTDSVVVVDGETVAADGATFIPTGGTSVAVASAELRFPSPFLPRLLRLAAFVDAGTIGTRSLQDLAVGDWKFTPGLGLRLQTPVGPARFDVAYNPYERTTGPLLLSNPETGALTRVGQHQPGARNFWQRLHIHVAIGQAF